MTKNQSILYTIKYLTLILSLLPLSLLGQQTYRTEIVDKDIRSLRLRYLAEAEENGGSTQRPFLILHNGIVDGTETDNTLEISFDEMSHDVHFYTYTLLHLNADGTPSALSSNEYIQGFTTQDITYYEHSLNTQRAYTHYQFTFPNEEMQIITSGRYALEIYEDGNREHVIARVCFEVVEPRVEITTNIRANTTIELNGRYQQLDIDVNTAALGVRDPNEIRVVVQQNGRTDNQVILQQPTFIEGDRLRYQNQRALIFEGGNEYRHFDAYSIYFAGSGIDHIEYDNRDYHAFLFADALKGVGANLSGDVVTDKCGIPYKHTYDANGQRIINAERTDYPDTEAEYIWVHWLLPRENPWFDGSIYVGGDLFLNQFGHENRMQYDNEMRCYYLHALVKQGGCDYQYWFVPKGQSTATLQRTEGSHWQTENDYRVYIYYRPFGSRYDQLVGIK